MKPERQQLLLRLRAIKAQEFNIHNGGICLNLKYTTTMCGYDTTSANEL